MPAPRASPARVGSCPRARRLAASFCAARELGPAFPFLRGCEEDLKQNVCGLGEWEEVCASASTREVLGASVCVRVPRGRVERLRQRRSRFSPSPGCVPYAHAAGDWRGPGRRPEMRPATLARFPAGFVPGSRVCPVEGPAVRTACPGHRLPCTRGGPRAAPASCMQQVPKEELQPTGRLRGGHLDQAQWGASIGRPHCCAAQLQTAQRCPASAPLLPGAPSPHLPALRWDLSFHPLLPTWCGLNCIPQTACFNPPEPADRT